MKSAFSYAMYNIYMNIIVVLCIHAIVFWHVSPDLLEIPSENECLEMNIALGKITN